MALAISEAEKTDMQARFTTACKQGWMTSVSTLLRHVNPRANDSAGIRLASRNGHEQVVRALLADGRANPRANTSEAVTWASVKGHVGVVRALLADGRADPRAKDTAAIYWASLKGHEQVVRALLVAGCARDRAIDGGRVFGEARVLRACMGSAAWFAGAN